MLARAWAGRGMLACLLWPASLLFGLLAALRRHAYAVGWLRAERLPVPVIVVGNIFVGGTGKTPLVIWLVQALRKAGYAPGVVSRGYGAPDEAPRPVRADSDPGQCGDEPVLIVRRTGCPLVVGRERAAAGRELLRAFPHVNVIVSDDGLQHYALARDIEIVLFDERGLGNGWLLPAGPLREPPSRRRDCTVVNAAAMPRGMPADAVPMRLAGAAAERLRDPGQRMALGPAMPLPESGKPAVRLAAAAGIGNPRRFFSMLRAAGLRFDELALPDHFDFAADTFAGLDADMVLITEKDAVKCARIQGLKDDPRLWVVPVDAQLDPALADRILEKLRGLSIA